MNASKPPQDGDFAAYLEAKGQGGAAPPPPVPSADPAPALALTEELVQELEAMGAVELSDEELERQALAAPGADGDPQTPE